MLFDKLFDGWVFVSSCKLFINQLAEIKESLLQKVNYSVHKLIQRKTQNLTLWQIQFEQIKIFSQELTRSQMTKFLLCPICNKDSNL